MKLRTTLLLIFGFSILTGAKIDRVNLEIPRELSALRLATSGVRIDGILDEDAWQRGERRSNFVQRNPLEGEEPTERTEFTVLYDNEYIYVGIWAYDSRPDSIASILSRRDEETPSDWVNVSFDSYADYRTAFEFWLNPLGVKRDVRRFNDEENDINWDAIWEGKTDITPDGWTAEFRIPLRELRFSGESEQTWGLQVYRHISRKNEDNYWTYWSKDEGGWVRHYGRLNQLVNIPQQRQVYFSPYTTGQYASSQSYKSALHPNAYNIGSALGADLKIGVSNNLTLDVTFNPDFGQVEADPAELNISAFESFFTEKRPFFVEGSNIYAFSLGNGRTTLFYPRRIGRNPHFWGGNGVDDDANGYEVDQPSATSILTAVKLTGKTANGWSIGIMEAIGAREAATIKYDDRSSEDYVVEPLTNYFVSRVQRDLNEGRTSIGVILTSVDRDLSGSLGKRLFGEVQQDVSLMRTNLNGWARSGGIDFRHRFKDDTYEIETAVAGTIIQGTREAILNAQLHPNRYFQRPDATHLGVNPDLTRLGGFYAKAVLSKIKGDHWIWTIANFTYSPGFESNDIGFNRQVDDINQFVWAQYRENEPGELLRRYNINFNGWSSYSFAGLSERKNLGSEVEGNFTLLNYMQFGGGLNLQAPGLHTTALWGGPALRQDAGRHFWLWYQSDGRKAVSAGITGWRGGQTQGGTAWSGVSPNLTWRPTNYFTMRLSGSYNYFFDTWANWSGYGTTEDLQTGEQHYIMSDLRHNTLSATIRLDVTLSPTLSIQFYGSPFVTSGDYRNDKMVNVDKARDPDFDARYTTFTAAQTDFDGNPNTYDLDGDGVANIDMLSYWGERDFNFKQFNSNLVVRWEYITGSSIFFVWSRNMSEFLSTGDYTGGGDLKDLFKLTGENVFLIKASYLLNI